jgi:hypothetical protein
MDFVKFSEYGIVGLVVGALFLIIWRMLIWVMKWVDKQAEAQNLERQTWLKTITALNESINTHNLTSIESRKISEEAHKFQRKEHKEMITTLGRINGYKP